MQWDGPPEEPGLQGTPVMLAMDRKLEAAGYWFDESSADHMVDLARFVRQPGNKPLVLAEYQTAFLRRLFGWMMPPELAWQSLGLEGTPQYQAMVRRYKFASMWAQKGNGKTPLAALISAQMLTRDGEADPHIDIMANTYEQAKTLTFADIVRFIENSPALNKLISITAESLYCPQTGGRARVLPSKEEAVHGGRHYLMAYDEVHTFTKRGIYEATHLSLKKRPRSLELITSSMGTNHLCFGAQMFESDEMIWRGDVEDPSRLVMAFYSDEKEDWKNPELWAAMNPAWGLPWGPKAIDFENDMRRIATDPQAELSFRVLHVGQRLRDFVCAIKTSLWQRANAKKRGEKFPTIEELVAAKAQFFFGLDPSQSDDITSFVAMARLANGMHYVFPYSWVPADMVASRGAQHRMPYEDWVRKGELLTTPGTMVERGVIVKTMGELHRRTQCSMCHADSGFAFEMLDNLSEQYNMPVARVAQNYNTYTPAAAKLQELLHDDKLRHPGNAVLDWAANTMTYVHRGDQVQPRKFGPQGSAGAGGKGTRRYKIDPMVALLLSLSASLSGDAQKPFDFNTWLKGSFS